MDLTHRSGRGVLVRAGPVRSRHRVLLPLSIILVMMFALVIPVQAAPVDINPDTSTNSNPNAATGGRVNGLANDANNNQVFYAASEYGGLYKTTDGGSNWTYLTGHAPQVTWDVSVDPSNGNRVYATSWFDGRVDTGSGIQVSNDGGTTWTHPATAHPDPSLEGGPNDNTPDPGFSCATARRSEPSAFGVEVRPDNTNTVFAGTNCGVAVSTDAGATWTYRDPTPATPATDVWDVVVQPGGTQGIVDVCGADGHHRSTDGGVTWTAGGALPAGRCSIAASPDESYVLFVYASDNNVYESDDAGATWTNLGSPQRQGRIPVVVTNQRADTAGGDDVFDLWAGDVQLFSTSCTTPATPAMGGTARCPTSASWTNQNSGAHFDSGDLEFDSSVTVDACPRVYSSDGGMHRNTTAGSPGCHNPTWTRSNVGLHALWSWTMSGFDRAGDTAEDLYFGTQDNGTFATTNAGAASPTWTNPNCCDTFDMVAGDGWVLGTVCCFGSGRFNRLELANPGYTGASQINTYPPGNIPGFTFGERMDTFGDDDVVIITSAGVFTTGDIEANPIVWTQLGALPAGTNACSVEVSITGGTPTFFVQSGQCTGRGADQVFSHVGTGAGTWNRIDNNDGLTGGFGVFSVDPNDPDRIYASNLDPAGPQMVFSTDGGATWDPDTELDDLMTADGEFLYLSQRGPSTNRGGAGAVFQGYPQPCLLKYSPFDGNVIVAGGQDSGIFLSVDGGANWSLVTDPLTPWISGMDHIPRPRFAYFDDEPSGSLSFYVASQGRGVWRLEFQLPIADANGPYTTPEGTNVLLDASGSSDPDGGILSYSWDLDGDGVFGDATGVTVTFDTVGQDGVFDVAVKVTDPDGGYDIDSTTVTVDNVAPTVALAANDPVDENSPVTVTGTISDPGWLDPLTATIDWGDGTGIAPISGTLENVRPDATLSFTVQHTYGDNGLFTAEVCGSDDDTTTCAEIDLTVDNVNPTAEIDETGTVLINGIPTIIAHAGDPVDFSATSDDPGSDDLFFEWDWDDGPPVPDVIGTHLVNPPDPDPFPSPTIQPRVNVLDMQTHSFGDACLYDVGLRVVDDDGGTALDSIAVIIAGNAEEVRSAGYWKQVFQRDKDFSDAEQDCYLAIVNYVSQVFSEVTDADSIADALEVLKGRGETMEEIFDRQLLAALLNFANGAIEWDQLIDTDGDFVGDTMFSDVIVGAELVRNDPLATRAELKAQKDLLERINLGLA